MTIFRCGAVALLTLFTACGGCDDDGNKTPDAFIIHDMAIDARNCTSVTAGTVDFLGGDADAIAWAGPVPGDLGDGLTLEYQFEFYSGIEASLSGTFDLHAGNQANYSSCAVCVRAFGRGSNGMVMKQYFQSAGSLTLTEDPFTNQHMIASITGLQLEEVTVNSQTFVSTPVAGGACANFADHMVDHDRVPNAWTCAHADWDTGVNCNCMCGTPDPDCTINAAPVMGCTTGQACAKDMCVTAPTNDTCATAGAIVIGTPVNGSSAGAQRNYNMGLEGATCTDFPQPGSDVAYTLALTAAQAITVTLSNVQTGFDPSIALVGPGAATICDATPITTCVAGADAGIAGQGETFMYTATTAGTYFLIVDAFDINDGGTFTLNVTSP